MKNHRILGARLPSGVFLLIMVLAMLTQISEVASATTTVEAGSISLSPGGTGKVPVTVKGISASGGLGAYDLEVKFNPNVVQVQDVVGGTSPFEVVSAKNINNDIGQVTFNSWIYVMQGPTGSITVAYLVVKAVGSGGSSSSITISEVTLVDAESASIIPATPIHGSVTIEAPKSPSSVTIALDREEARIDETVTVSGRISPQHSAPVTLSFTRPDGTRLSRTTSSRSDGTYTHSFEPDMAGAWKVSASWFGDANHYGASSPIANFMITRLNSSLSVLASPMVLEPNGSLRIEGLVSPARDGASVKLDYRSSKGEWKAVAEVSTNSTGGFSYDWDTELTIPSQYEVRASWLGDHVFEGAESSLVRFYIAEDSALSIRMSSNSTGVDAEAVVRGEVSPPHAYVNVTISVEAPNGSAVTVTAQTDNAGNYKVTFVPDTVGVWRFGSSWPGDFNTHGSESMPVELRVISVGSSISLQTDASSITMGGQTTFSGKIEPSASKTEVAITLTRPDSSLVTLGTTSGADGVFSGRYAPDQAGVWLAQASWSGNEEYGGATSRSVSFTVDKSSSTLSLYVNPPIPTKGDLVTFEGILGPSISPTSVEILMSEDEGQTWSSIASPSTESDGSYSTAWRAEKIGTFCFQAVWEGSEAHAGCASRVIKLTIQEEIASVSVRLADGYETWVFSSTNSSTIAVTVNPENGRVDAEVTGPNGTRGLMNIFITEELLNSNGNTIGDLVFSVDGISVPPEIVEVEGGYLVTIAYDHSARTISTHYLTYRIAIEVTDYGGQVVVGANVYMGGPIMASGVTDGSGTVSFANMPRGNYTVQIDYGGKVGENSLNLVEDDVLTISTVVGKIDAEYSDLQKEYADLEQKYFELQQNLATIQTAIYLFVIIVVAFTSIYFATKGKGHIRRLIRRFQGSEMTSPRGCSVRGRLRGVG